MPNKIVTTDSDGVIRTIGMRGCGFAVLSAGDTPGSYPLTVKAPDTGDEWRIYSSRPFYSIKPFEWLRIEGATPSSSYNVHVFRDKAEGLGPPGGRSRRGYVVQAATAIPTAAPAGNVGWEVLATQLGWEFVFANVTTETLKIWAKSLGGVWTDSLVTFDATSEAVAFRYAYSPGTRIYVQSSGAGPTQEVSRVMEVE